MKWCGRRKVAFERYSWSIREEMQFKVAQNVLAPLGYDLVVLQYFLRYTVGFEHTPPNFHIQTCVGDALIFLPIFLEARGQDTEGQQAPIL